MKMYIDDNASVELKVNVNMGRERGLRSVWYSDSSICYFFVCEQLICYWK